MDFAVVHRIHDPEGWGKSSKVSTPIHRTSICIRSWRHRTATSRSAWREAPSEAALQEALDRIFGHAAVNEVFPAALRVMGGRGVEGYVPGWRARV